jgi:hypothetical protein
MLDFINPKSEAKSECVLNQLSAVFAREFRVELSGYHVASLERSNELDLIVTGTVRLDTDSLLTQSAKSEEI